MVLARRHVIPEIDMVFTLTGSSCTSVIFWKKVMGVCVYDLGSFIGANVCVAKYRFIPRSAAAVNNRK